MSIIRFFQHYQKAGYLYQSSVNSAVALAIQKAEWTVNASLQDPPAYDTPSF